MREAHRNLGNIILAELSPRLSNSFIGFLGGKEEPLIANHDQVVLRTQEGDIRNPQGILNFADVETKGKKLKTCRTGGLGLFFFTIARWSRSVI